MNNQNKNHPQGNTDPLVGTILSDFRIDSLIGAGGMGTVYKATQLSLDKTVAIKVLLPELVQEEGFVDRFANEARLGASLEQQNIVRIISAGEDKGFYFIAMEYVDGEDLRDYGKAKKTIGETELAFIIREAAKGLKTAHEAHEAHEKKIIHRDVKTDNIMITRRGEVKLADFGIAKAVMGSDKTQTAFATRQGMTIGTPKYMSPEQALGEELDGRSDLYSLGIILYEMLVGKVPFEGDNPVTVGIKQVKEKVILPPHTESTVSKKMQTIIYKLLEKRREDRYQSAKELIFALEIAFPDIRGAATIDEIGKAPAGQGKGGTKKILFLLLTALIIILAGLGVGAYWFWGPGNMGTLAVVSTPDKAAVFFDGAMIGQTPLSAKVVRGEHEIRIAREDFQSAVQKVTIVRGKTKRVEIALEALKGGFKISTDPAGASVAINEEVVGQTPLELTDVTPGTYRIELTKEGFQGYSLDTRVVGDQTVNVEHVLVRDPIFVYLEEGKENFKKGNYELCITDMDQVLAHYSDHEEAAEYKSRCENKIKMRERAKRSEERRARKKQLDNYIQAGKTAHDKGQYKLCIAKMDEALRIERGNKTAKEFKSKCEEAGKEVLRKWQEELDKRVPVPR
jgi:hypothetical protein